MNVDRPSLLTWLATRDPLPVMDFHDPVAGAVGHDARSAYVETYWTPTLGPTALLLLRRLADGLERRPHGFSVPLAVLSRKETPVPSTGRTCSATSAAATGAPSCPSIRW